MLNDTYIFLWWEGLLYGILWINFGLKCQIIDNLV